MRSNTKLRLVFPFPHFFNCFSCMKKFSLWLIPSSPRWTLAASVRSISCGRRERSWGGEEEGKFDRSLPGSHAFVIKLLILCCAGNAPPCTFANFCIFFSSGWPLSLPAVPSHINPILLHFGHSTNRWCFLSTRLPNSSNLSYLCLFL